MRSVRSSSRRWRGSGRLGLAGLALGIAASAAANECAPLDVDAILGRVAPRIDSFVLDNGLRVHLVPRAGDRTVSVRVGYDVGARDEAPGRGGVAHLFEHMMFKGSQHISDGGHFRLVKAAGGVTNAVTDYDTTQYWSTVPREALPRVLFAEADRMRGLRIDDATLTNQRAAIREEGLGLENLPYVAPATEFGLRLWRETPYGHSPLGTPEELAATTVEEAARFHERYYTPRNAVLVVAGGLDVARTRADVERLFGELPSGTPRPPRPSFRVDRTAVEQVARDPLAPFPVHAVAWHTVGVREGDALAVAVLDDLLMGHANARLRRRIAEPLTLDAYALPVAFRDVGLLNYVFVPRLSTDFDTIRGVLREVAESLRKEGPSVAEVCRSRRQEQRERLEALATAEGLAAAVAHGALLHGDARAFARELTALDALGPEAIRQVAQAYLVDDFSTLEIQPAGFMRFVKRVLEWLPAGVGASLEASLL